MSDVSEEELSEASESEVEVEDEEESTGPAALPSVAFDYPAPLWSNTRPDGAPQPPVRVVEITGTDRVLPDTMSEFEFARLTGIEATQDRTSDDANAGAMRKVYEGKSPLTIRRHIRRYPAVYRADGTLEREEIHEIEVWRSSELHIPFSYPGDDRDA